MYRKFLTGSIVALFCLGFTMIALADAPDGGTATADTYDAGTVSHHEEAPDPGPSVPPPPAVTDPADATFPGGFDELVQAFRTGDWRLVAAFALIAVMIGLRRIRDKVPWFRGDRGGAIMVMLLSLSGALSTSLAADQPVDAKLFLSAITIAWVAVGGYTWLKRLIWPGDKTGEDKPAELPKAQVVVR